MGAGRWWWGVGRWGGGRYVPWGGGVSRYVGG